MLLKRDTHSNTKLVISFIPLQPPSPLPPKKTLRLFYEIHFRSLLSDVTRVTDALPDDQKQVYEEIKNNKTIMDQAKKKVIAKYNGDIEAVRYSFIYFFIFLLNVTWFMPHF